MSVRDELEKIKGELIAQGLPKEAVEAEINSIYGEFNIPEEPSLSARALDYGLRGLDYAGGIARTLAADVVSPADAVTMDDWKAAMRGQAPNTAQYMDRVGVPEGAKVNLPFIGDVSTRDVGGFVGDVALDPLTYASLGASAVGKLGKAGKVAERGLTAGGRAAKATGDAIYKSGFKKIDEGLVERGMKPLSQVMIDAGRPVGTVKGLSKKAGQIGDNLMAERELIYDAIERSGQKVNIPKAMEPSIGAMSEQLRRNPALDGQMGAMEDWLLKYGRDGDNVPVQLASDWKTTLYDGLPQAAYGPMGKVMPAPKEVQKQFARGLKEGIEDAGRRAGGEKMGQRITAINEDLGSLISAQKPMAREVRKANTKNVASSVDGAGVGYALANPGIGIPVLAGKKLGDLSKTTAFKTGLGRAGYELGNSGLLDPVLRQMMIEANRSPWTDME